MPSMKNSRPTVLASLALLLLFSACSARRVDPLTLPPDDLYGRAMTQYEARDFADAIPLFQAFVQAHLGDPRAPEAMFLLARSHMERREYLSAATYFQRLVSDFPSSPRNLAARFATCEAYAALSPRPQLDQEYTRAALSHCESIGAFFPGTTEAENATRMVAEMREKLAEKIYQNGLFYQRRRAYDSAVIYFGDVVEQYPQSVVAPAALGKLIETYEVLGYVEDATEARARLRQEYPTSEAAQALPADTASAAQ